MELPNRNQRYATRSGQPIVRLVSDTSTAHESRSSVGYQPIIEKTNLGALLEIRHTLMPGQSVAVVDMMSTITVSAKQPEREKIKADSGSLAPEVDRIAIETQQFATTLRVPVGKPILVGGLTHAPTSSSASDGGKRSVSGRSQDESAESPQLYFVLKIQQLK